MVRKKRKEEDKKQKRKGGIIIAIIIVVLLLLLSIFLTCWLNRDAKYGNAFRDYLRENGIAETSGVSVDLETLINAGYLDAGSVGDYCPGSSYITISEGQYKYDFKTGCSNSDDAVNITLNGESIVNIQYGMGYVEYGANITAGGKNLNQLLSINSDEVDTQKLGTYKVTYVAKFEGEEYKKTRTVRVVDTTPPVIVLKNSSTISIVQGSGYVEPGFTATDNLDGDITNLVEVAGNVDSTRAGSYVVSYKAVDSSGNHTTIERTVNVIASSGLVPPSTGDGGSTGGGTTETGSPSLALIGNAIVYVEYPDAYVEPGFIAKNASGAIENGRVSTSSNIGSDIGRYTVVYTYISSGVTLRTTREVIVRDTTAPKVMLNGNSVVYQNLNTPYVELGATVTDNRDTGLTPVIIGSVDHTSAGSYTLTYEATDSSGNKGVTQRTVVIEDSEAPVLHLDAAKETVTIERGTNYDILDGLSVTDNSGVNLHSYITYVSNPTFDANKTGVYTVDFSVRDLSNNLSNTVTKTVTVVDTISPTATVSYSQTGVTAGPVVATVTGSEPITIPGWSCTQNVCTKSYDANATETVTFMDLGGNTGTANISIANIDAVEFSGTATRNIDTPTNGSVKVTIVANKVIKTIPAGWTRTDDYTYYQYFGTNFTGYVEITSELNEVADVLVVVNNIDVTPITTVVTKTPDGATNGTVLVKISANKTVTTGEAGWTCTDNICEKTFAANGVENVMVTDAAGNSKTVVVEISNIDLSAPTVTVNYSETSVTRGPVLVTLTANEPIQYVTSWTRVNETTLIKSFETNIDTAISVEDLVGNMSIVPIKIENIDSIPLIVDVDYSNTEMTKGSVTVTISTNKDIEVIAGWDRLNDTTYQRTFTSNFMGIVTVKDLIGNTNTVTITVSNIDNVLPMISSVSYSPEGPTQSNVATTVVFTEAVKPIIGFTQIDEKTYLREFTDNVTGFTVVFEDLAGNINTDSFDVTNIDRIAPVGTIEYDPAGPTNGNVTVTLKTSEQVADIDGWQTISGTEFKKEYTDNTTDIVTYVDIAGNSSTSNITINNIDRTAPTVVSFTKTPDTPNAGEVEATIIADKDITIENWSCTANICKNKYYVNIDESVVIEDLAGNSIDYSFTIDNIDEEDLTAEVTYSPDLNTPTRNTVTVTITTNRPVNTINGWTKVDDYTFTKTYGDNITEDVNFTDMSNKQAFLTITITNIDRDAPVYQVSYSPAGYTRGSVIATINTEEDIQDIAGWTKINSKRFTKEYTENTVESVVITDIAGNSSAVTVNIDKIDKIPPTITLIGDTTVTINVYSTYIDQGYNVSDNVDANVTVNNISNVNPSAIGDYVYSYVATDGAGNSSTVSRIVKVRDLSAPVITVDDSLVSYEVGTNVNVLAGVSVSDNFDNLTTSNIVVTYEGGRDLDINVAGTYVAKFDVCDAAGNCAATKTKTIVMADANLPKITLDDSNVYEMEVKSTIPTFTAVAADSLGTPVTVNITHNILANKVGEYAVTFTATDTSNRTATEIRTFRVIDTTPPTIVVRGNSEMTLNYRDVYTELGVIITDNSGDDLEGNVSISGSVDTSILGTYYIYYVAYDNSGNQSNIVTRTVHVIDNSKPIITVDPDSYTIDVGDDINIMYGVTAWDNLDGDITSELVVNTGGFTNAHPGTYIISYDVTDSSGNIADTKTRKIRVTGHGIDAVVKSALSCQNYATCNYPSNATDNYVYYSGMLWRIMRINPDGTVKLIANDAVTTMPLDLSTLTYATDYSNMYISKYLNSYFYERLENTDILVQNADGTYIDLMTSAEYNTGSGYISNGSTIWTKTYYTTYRWYYANTNGALYTGNDGTAYTNAYHGIKPVITVQPDTMVVSGSGEYVNMNTEWTAEKAPYVIDSLQATPDVTKVNERVVGEYVNYAGKRWRITDINGGGNTELILDDVYKVGGTVTRRPMDTSATGTNAYFGFTRETSYGYYMDFTMNSTMFSAEDRKMILNQAPWYQTAFTVGNDPLTTSLGKTNRYDNLMGLPRIGELFNTGGEVAKTYNENSYMLNVASGTAMFYANQQTANVSSATISTSYILRPKVMLNADIVITGGDGNISAPYEIVSPTDEDTTAPEIDLVQGDSITWEVKTAYIEPGFTAYDNKDGDITHRLVVDATDLDMDQLGTYSIIYRITDAAGNVKVVTRTVNVIDTTKPILSLTQPTQTIPKGRNYDPLNLVTATDNYDESIQTKITATPDIDTNVVGTYEITYNVMDQSGNRADSITRKLIVADNTITSIVGTALNCQEYATCYYASNASTNYVYYSGMLWRIMRINPDGTVKLIANDVVTSLPLDLGMLTYATDYSSMYISKYLNGYFYDRLSDTDILVQNADGSYVDLMTNTEYNTGSGYISNGSTIWTKSFYTTYRWYYANTNGALYTGNDATAYTNAYHGIKPVITLKPDTVVVSGTGEYTNKDAEWIEFKSPYVIESEQITPGETKVNESVVGEYVNYAGQRWRITNINEGGNTELILDDMYRVGSTVTRRPIDSSASGTNALFDPTRETSYGYYMKYTMDDLFLGDSDREMILKEAPWYQSYFTVGSDPLVAGMAKTNIYETMIGLPKVGELFTVGGEVPRTYNETMYLLNPASGTQMQTLNPQTGNFAAANINSSLLIRPKVMLNADIIIASGFGNIKDPYELTNETLEDTTKPVVTLAEGNDINWEVNTMYVEPGFVAYDNKDGDITHKVIVNLDNLDLNTLGTYTVDYIVQDARDNVTVETRTIHVVDTTKPVLSLNQQVQTIPKGRNYDPLNMVYATDNYDVNIQNKITATPAIDTNVMGTYTITYNVVDQSGNAADPITRTLIVTDNTLSSMVKSELSCLDYQTCNYPSNSTNNYVYYSGMLWRVMRINPDGTVKLVADDVVTTMPLDLNMLTNATDYSNMYISKYLNGYFYDRLDNTDILVQNADGSYVDLMTNTEYNTGSGYISNGSTIWTKTFYTTYRWYYVNTNGALYGGNDASAYTNAYHGIKPVITINATAILDSGTGEYVNKNTEWTEFKAPYVIEYDEAEDGVTMVNERHVGEYVNYSGRTWRITNINAGGNTELILEDAYRVGDIVTRRPIDSNATGTNAFFEPTRETSYGHYMRYIMDDTFLTAADKQMILNNAPWYQSYFAVGWDPLTTSLGKTNEYDTAIGMPRIGELFTAGGETMKAYNENTWMLNVLSGSGVQMFAVNQQTANVTSNAINSSYILRPKVMLNADMLVTGGYGNIYEPFEIASESDTDTINPDIILTNGAEIDWEVHTTYVEPGYFAIDNKDGDITHLVAVDSTDLNLDLLGTYEIVYRVSDSRGNIRDVVRTINVIDTTKPVLTLSQSTQSIPKGSAYDPLNLVYATDNYDVDIQSKIVATPTIDTDVIGRYEITYSVVDQSGNVADTITRTVIVTDNTLSSMVKSQLGCIDYQTCYYPSAATNNYVYYSGMLWRIMRLNPDNTVRLVANDVVATMPLDLNNLTYATDYSSMYISTYLNGYFYDRMNGTDILVQNADGTYIDLMTNAEYNAGGGYISNGSTIWTKSYYTTYRWYYVNTNGALYTGNDVSAYTSAYHGIKPTITIAADAVIMSGTGDYVNQNTEWSPLKSPYMMQETKAEAGVTAVNERSVGEYVAFAGKKWRITDIRADGTVEIIMEDAYRSDSVNITKRAWDTSAVSGNVIPDYTRETSIGHYMKYFMVDSFLTDTQKSYLVQDNSWYQGATKSATQDPLATTLTDMNPYVSTVGFPRIGELFTTGGENLKTINDNIYTLSMLDGLNMYIVNQQTGNVTTTAVNGSYMLRPKVLLRNGLTILSGDGNITNPYVFEP